MSFSVDGGAHWVRIKGGMPTITIRGLEIQKRESDLVAASFGRGFFVLDDYLGAAPLDAAKRCRMKRRSSRWDGRRARIDEIGYYRAGGDNASNPNPPIGALLTYYLRDTVARRCQDGADRDRFGGQAGAPDRRGGHGGAASHAMGFARTRAGGAGRAWTRRCPCGRCGGTTSERAMRLAALPAVWARRTRGAWRAAGDTGAYTVQLGKLVNGTVTPIGDARKIEVVPLEPSNR